MTRSKLSRNAANWLGCGALALVAAACASDKTPAREPVAMGEMTTPGPQHPTGLKESDTTIRISEEFQRECQIPGTPTDVPHFDYADSTLRPRGANILDDVAKCMSTGPLKGRVMTIIGRTDPRGSAQYNQQLSANRAEAARNYLVQKGVPAEQIRILPRGEQAAIGTDEQTWALDRRVDLELGDRAGTGNAVTNNLNASPDPMMQGMRLQAEAAKKDVEKEVHSKGASYSTTAEGGHEVGESGASKGSTSSGSGSSSASGSASASGSVTVGGK